jgi:hypothetical protein
VSIRTIVVVAGSLAMYIYSITHSKTSRQQQMFLKDNMVLFVSLCLRTFEIIVHLPKHHEAGER